MYTYTHTSQGFIQWGGGGGGWEKSFPPKSLAFPHKTQEHLTRYGHDSTALVEAKFSALINVKKTWQSTIPETSAKVYGAWRIPTYV